MATSSVGDHLWCHHALDWLLCPLFMRVMRSVECGSHVAAAAALTTRRVVRR
ncbi:hypothetical protein [Chloroflexus sp.]|uniref:hypothetical protein n=1 Tax=Chloroflexus sp. TaxID=1904827 RepID=UPI00404A8CC6